MILWFYKITSYIWHSNIFQFPYPGPHSSSSNVGCWFSTWIPVKVYYAIMSASWLVVHTDLVLLNVHHPSVVSKTHCGQSYFFHPNQQTQDEAHDRTMTPWLPLSHVTISLGASECSLWLLSRQIPYFSSSHLSILESPEFRAICKCDEVNPSQSIYLFDSSRIKQGWNLGLLQNHM